MNLDPKLVTSAVHVKVPAGFNLIGINPMGFNQHDSTQWDSTHTGFNPHGIQPT